MKFRSERDSLLETLSTAARAVGTRGTSSPVLSGLLLTCSKNRLIVVGTDLDLTITAEQEVIGIDDGSCVIPARLSTDIVRRLEAGAVTLETDDDQVTITSARSKFTLRTFPVVEFPQVTNSDSPTIELPSNLLSESVRQVVRAASNDSARPLLTGVLLTSGDVGARLVATDSYRLAFRDLEGVVGVDLEDLLIPARALHELQRLGSQNSPVSPKNDGQESTNGENYQDKVTIASGAHQITFTRGSVRISTRLLEGTYPDYHQLIPDHYPNQIHLGKETFISALRRVQLLVRDSMTPVRLSMRQGGVDMSVVSQEVGDASETVDGDFTGQDTIIAFNPAYLIDGVEAVSGDEVIIEVADSAKPATVRAVEDETYRYLLMPVRVS